jgi:hypothetical protein
MLNLYFCLISKLIRMSIRRLLIIPAMESALAETPTAGLGMMSDLLFAFSCHGRCSIGA